MLVLLYYFHVELPIEVGYMEIEKIRDLYVYLYSTWTIGLVWTHGKVLDWMDVTEEAMIKNKELRATNFELFGASFLFLGVWAFIPVGI